MHPLSSSPLDSDVAVVAGADDSDDDALADVEDNAEDADAEFWLVDAPDVVGVAAAVVVSVAVGDDVPQAPSSRTPAAHVATTACLGVTRRDHRIRRIMRCTPRGESVRVRPLRRDRPECGRSPTAVPRGPERRGPAVRAPRAGLRTPGPARRISGGHLLALASQVGHPVLV